jgi:hypothetical protein
MLATVTRLGAATLLLLSQISCGASSTEPAGEEEVISRVTLQLTPEGGGATQSAFIEDADGAGPGAPSAQSGTLSLTRGVTYSGTVQFENRLVTPVEDITAEVRAEPNEHRVFYSASSPGISLTTSDVDGQNRPLGLAFTTAVGAAATAGAGTIRVQLCHYSSTLKTGDATSCTGDTDILVTFSVAVN